MVLGTVVPVAFASTTATATTHWNLTLGSYSQSVPAVVAQDSGHATSFLPIYYLQQALKGQGYNVQWNGSTGTLNVTTPGTVTPDLSNISAGNGSLKIYLNGTLVQEGPFVVAKDPNTGRATSFVPIWYVEHVLARVGLGGGSDAFPNWTIASSAKLAITGANGVGVGGQEKLGVTVNGAAVTGATFSVSGAGAVIDNNGNFVASAAGTYTVTAAYQGQTATATIAVYGAATGVNLSAAAPTVVSNGLSTDALTVKVVDASGNTVSNYNGTATLAFATSGQNGAVGALWNSATGAWVTAAANATVPVTVVNGVGTVKVEAGTTPGVTDNLYVSGVVNTSNTALDNASGTVAQSTSVAVGSVVQVATSLSFAPSSKTVEANDTQGSDVVYVQVNDQSGQPMLSGQFAVNVTVSGVGRLVGSANGQTTLVYNGSAAAAGSTNTSAAFTLDSVQGSTGSISFSASATGLTAGSGSVTSVIAGSPYALKITPVTSSFTSGAAEANGAEYTVEEVDSNGNPINGSGDGVVNVAFTMGGAAATWLNVQAATAAGIPSAVNLNSTGTVALTMTNGQATFFVSDTSAGDAGQYSITATSPTSATYNLTSATTALTETTGTINSVGVTSPAASIVVSEASPSTSYTLQLEDANSNAINQAGVTVDVYAIETSSGMFNPAASAQTATVNGTTMYGNSTASNEIAVTTNANGQATVTLNPQSYNGATWELMYSVPVQAGVSSAIGAVASPTIELQPAPTNQLAVSLKDVTNGADVNSTAYALSSDTVAATVSALDQYGNALTSDTDTVNIAVPAGLSGSTMAPTGTTAVDPWVQGAANVISVPLVGGTKVVDFTAWTEGASTLKVSDATAPAAKAASATINVQPGSASAAALFQGGKEVTSSNPVTVTANSPIAVQIEPVDTAGNPVLSATTQTYSLSDGGNGGVFESSASGGTETTVTVPAGSSAVTVYYMNGNAGSYTLSASVASGQASNLAVTSNFKSGTTLVTTGLYSDTATVKLSDQYGNGIAAGTLADFSLADSTPTTYTYTTSTTPGAGDFTVTNAGNGSYTITLYTASTTFATTTATVDYSGATPALSTTTATY